MKILYLTNREPDETIREIIHYQKKMIDVTIVDMRTEKDRDRIIDLIASNDKVISW